MHKRPSLQQAIALLQQYSAHSEEAAEALQEYSDLKASGQQFLASRYVVEIVDHFNHIRSVAVNG